MFYWTLEDAKTLTGGTLLGDVCQTLSEKAKKKTRQLTYLAWKQIVVTYNCTLHACGSDYFETESHFHV